MPKRKAATKPTGLIGSDYEDVMATSGNEGPAQEQRDDERPVKRARGRPKSLPSKDAETTTSARPKTRPAAAAAPTTQEVPSKKSGRRGRPKGSRISADSQVQETVAATEDTENEAPPQEKNFPVTASEEPRATRQTSVKPAKPTKAAATRGRRKGSGVKPVQTDGEFEYTPTISRQIKSPEKPNDQPAPAQRTTRRRRADAEVEEAIPESQVTAAEVDETVLADEPVVVQSAAASPTKLGYNRRLSQRPLQESPRRWNGSEVEKPNEPELRRKLGDLTKKYDALETKFRNLKEIGVVEASANVEKMKKQCEAITSASNALVSSLKTELETQRSLAKQTRVLEKQLKERDTERTRLESQTEELSAQLSSAQTEIKALQTKLAAARNTAASIESAASKPPGSAVKNTVANRAHAAANAEAAHAAQFAQLKEDLYSDLTGLIIRDVKKRESDHLYDCIQTGVNGTLHFKLAVPHVSATNYDAAEFHYVPLLDENRDRDLVQLLPDYLTVDITFSRAQASKFYTRVIDTLTKRRTDSLTS